MFGVIVCDCWDGDGVFVAQSASSCSLSEGACSMSQELPKPSSITKDRVTFGHAEHRKSKSLALPTL